jgi:putative pyridoxal-dependent aspartate 1-decarboxylase
MLKQSMAVKPESTNPKSTMQHNIEDTILQLFAPSTLAATHLGIDTQLAVLVRDFLASQPRSGLALDDLQAQFEDSTIPTQPMEVETYVDYLASQVIPHSTPTASPQFIGHMTSALPSFVPPLARLMTLLNQNVVKLETAKAFSPYERQALAIMHRLIYNCSDAFYQQHVQNNQSTLGILGSGGTTANITALWCARNTALGPKNQFPGVEKAGLAAALNFYGYQGAVVIGSELMHYSFDKAADLLGIGMQGLIKLPTDHRNRVRVEALQQEIAQCQDRKQLILAIVGVAGTTDSGGIDPLSEIAAIAHTANVHFHVDAAWAGPLLFSQQHRPKLAGIEQADSVTIDGHKQLYLPMGIGMLFLRDPHKAQGIEKQASYTMRNGSPDLGKRALEGSRPAMALFLHAGLNLIGTQGYAFLIDEGIRKTRYMADCIRAMPELELLSNPEINLLLYRYIPPSLQSRAVQQQLTATDHHVINQFNERLQKAQRQAGRTFISRTTRTIAYAGQDVTMVALRAVIANPLTTESDIDAVLADQLQIAQELLQSEHVQHVASYT